MKIVWVALGLLIAGIGVGVACGPKETYCYKEGKPCSDIAREIRQADATADWYVFPDSAVNKCFAPDGAMFTSVDPCP